MSDRPPNPTRRTGGWRLADAPSGYLRSAAEQAIEWYPWGSEAFERARGSSRPVLLDIGASWCHWCHVMDEGTYSDPDVARLIGQHFVAVKVDRDQHPEVDRRYQRQVGALTGEGGWPLTAFLTPGGEVFLGGTYFPPTDGHGRPGFRRVLGEVARLWKEEPERLRENARGIQDALARMRSRRSSTAVALDRFVDGVRTEILSSYDPVHGGFGTAPKFPHPTAIGFLLWDAFVRGEPSSLDRARETLLRMADGGLYDQVGGGFHRYAVDEGWHIPHFEKMGVDNAALLGAYVDGAQQFGEERFAEVVRGTVGWIRSVLGDPEGGFGASQDADNAPGDDGSYFTWSRAELRQVLDPAEARLVTRFFGVGTEARMPHDPDRNVLFRLLPLDEAAQGVEVDAPPTVVLGRALEKLRVERARRPPPTVDRALYADINGRLIGALARAGTFLGEDDVVDAARRAADRLLRVAYRPDRGVAHRLDGESVSGFGLLEDQVAFAGGLLELAVAVSSSDYLAPAVRILELVDQEFRGEDGLLRDVAPGLYDGPPLAGTHDPSYPLEDSPHLSANAAAALAFRRTGALLHEDSWTEKARALLPPIASRIAGAGLFAAGSALAAGLLTTDPVTVIVEGTGPDAAALLRAARRTWHPNVAVFAGRPPPPFSFPVPTGTTDAGSSRALLCSGISCAPPITEPEELRRRLSSATPTATA